MCSPMLALSAVGTAVSVAGNIAQGNAANRAAQQQALAYEQQARSDARAAGFEASRELERQRRVQGAATAQVAASGYGLTGSPLAVMADNASQGQLDIEAIKYGSQLRQGTLRTQAMLERQRGKDAKRASLFNAASSAASGLGNLYDPNRAVKLGGSLFA